MSIFRSLSKLMNGQAQLAQEGNAINKQMRPYLIVSANNIPKPRHRGEKCSYKGTRAYVQSPLHMSHSPR